MFRIAQLVEVKREIANRCREKDIREGAETARILGVDLLSQHIAAKRNTPLECDSSKVRTVPAFGIGPGLHGRNQSRDRGSNETKQAEVGANSLNSLAIFRPFRAKMEELHNPVEILAGRSFLNACNFLDFRRQRLLGGHGNERPAIEHEELQEYHNGYDENEGGHHLDTAARREGASLASSLTQKNVSVHAAGRIQPSVGVT